MNKLLALMSLLLFWFAIDGQSQTNSYAVKFVPTFNNQPLQLDNAYYLPNINDSVTIEGLRFYVSGVKLLKGDKVVHEITNGYYLVDATQPETQTLQLSLPKTLVFDQIQFHIGIDSLTNVSGAMDDALDPMNGMYWAWQSGFINFKLEGTSKACNTRNHKFQYHIGGYMPPYSALQTVTFPCTDNRELTVYIAIDKILGGLDLKSEPEIMSPGAKAVNVSTIIKQSFTTQTQP